MVNTIKPLKEGIYPLVPTMEERSCSENKGDRKIESQGTKREARNFFQVRLVRRYTLTWTTSQDPSARTLF